ncbi:MAG TPA: type I methionyl aminopeptidase [Chloroflexi bacterium]|nr:type I methionyl aminopeptidase [Chloroflexota bacterium]
MAIIIKSNDEIQIMRESAAINVEALRAVREAIRPGITTAELDRIAHEIIVRRGGKPAFLGHPAGSRHPFPATITVSINEELVHGIPGKRMIKEGDIVSIDCGTIYKGFVSDSAFTVGVGEISAEARRLLEVTEAALYKGIEACVPGNRLGDVSYAIQSHVESAGYSVVREYGGHGVGRSMWEDPHIPNWGRPGRGIRLRPGMALALEPMVFVGSPKTRVLDDHWTVVAADGSLCAHFEHTIVITPNGPEILTKLD